MLYVLYGEDDFSLYQSLEGIKRGIGDQATLEANTTVFEGQRLTLEQIKTACEAAPFLAERRLVIVNGLLERFAARGKSGRKKAGKATKQDDCKSFAEFGSQIPDSTILVLIDGKIKKDNPLLRELSGKAEVKVFYLLRGEGLRQWIQRRVKESGGSISPQAVDLLARFVGSNLWIMAKEIDKLNIYASGRLIEEEDVRQLVSYAQEADVFTMVDAILEFKGGLAEQRLRQLLQQGAAPAYLLVMLSRQVQLLVRARELREQRKSRAEIQDRLNLNMEFVLNKTLEQAGRHSMERLKGVYHRLLETDLSIKTGKYVPELALNILVAELCQQSSLQAAL